MRLLAWCRFQPRDAGIDDKLTRLLDEREGRGGWQTTQGNAWALLAMSAYARDVEKAGGPAAGTVSLAGENRDFQLGGKTQTFACEFPLAQLRAGGKLAVLKTAGRKLYVQARVESRPRGGAGINQQATVGSEDYSIVRHYQKVLNDGNLADAEGLKVGDRVLVSLDIHAPRLASYVAVNDPLPAVLEAINPEFKTADTGNVKADGYGWWVSDYKELREDRAVFFCDHLLFRSLPPAIPCTRPRGGHGHRSGGEDRGDVSSRPLRRDRRGQGEQFAVGMINAGSAITSVDGDPAGTIGSTLRRSRPNDA